MSDLVCPHRYFYTFDPQGDSLPAKVLRQVPPGSRVLELGPGPGSMTRVLQQYGCQVTAIERDPECAELCAAFCARLLREDLEHGGWFESLAQERFDVVLACDVLEHLAWPEAVLERLRVLLAPQGRLVVTVPNVAYLGLVAALLTDEFGYRDKGILDRTHLRFFTRREIERLLWRCGFAVERIEAQRWAVAQGEFAAAWERLPEALRWELRQCSPEGEVYQWLLVAKAREETAFAADASGSLMTKAFGQTSGMPQTFSSQAAAMQEDARVVETDDPSPGWFGVPPVVFAFPGIDTIGQNCGIDPTVSVYRLRERSGTIVLRDEVRLYAHTRLAVDDPTTNASVRLVIGRGTIVNVGCYLSGEGGLEIGEEVLIGPHAKLLSAGHEIHRGDPFIMRNPLTRAPIRVGNGAWIGAGAIVLPGVTIGDGAVVAAGAVVTNDVPAMTVVAGAPARVVRLRGDTPPSRLRRLWRRCKRFLAGV